MRRRRRRKIGRRLRKSRWRRSSNTKRNGDA
jgi:hypothetical protein